MLSDQDDFWRNGSIAAEFARRADLGLLFQDARLVDAEGCLPEATLLASLEFARRRPPKARATATLLAPS